jgi:DNA topoisomerase-1
VSLAIDLLDGAVSDPGVQIDAEAQGLVYVSDLEPGIVRRPVRSGFTYRDRRGRSIRDAATLARIRRLAIPPAWTEVWIAPNTAAHIQATGRDDRGRKQYRYHPDFVAVRDATKFGHMLDFAAALPAIRRRVAADIGRRGLPLEKVVAAIVWLLDATLVRVGNREYAKENGSFGLTTLRDRHVAVTASTMRFEFKGKSGKTWRLKLADRRIARVVKSCQDIPGQHLFQYVDEAGGRHSVGSGDVNAYLRAISGSDITAKDFRTWHGTVLAATCLGAYPAGQTKTAAKASIREAIEAVAGALGNTPAVCRRCYVHPEVIAAYLDGGLAPSNGGTGRAGSGLRPEERRVLALLRKRLKPARRQRRGRQAPASAIRGMHSRAASIGEDAHPR